MTDQTSPVSVDQIGDEIREATLLVDTASDRAEERDVVVSAHAAVAKVSNRYRELLETVSEGTKLTIERNLGRRLQDLRRLASLLPKAPTLVGESTPDRREGAGAVGERRITGVSWRSDAQRGPAPTTRVGGEVESWCGKCGDLTTHHIAAMVDDEPKQVVCQVCGTRHNHRTLPARKAATGTTATSTSSTRAPRDPLAERRAAEQRALAQELQTAGTVRTFSPKERYKAGEIINHPEFGRGKVENVLRASLLVRFSTGLKSVMLT